MRDSSQAVKADAEPTVAFPPRFWWLKRLTAVGVVVALLLVGLRLWWGHEAQRRLDAYVRAAQGRGEPILPEDFDPPRVPPEEDANSLYVQAAQGVTVTPQQLKHNIIQPPPVVPLVDTEVVTIEAILQSNARSLADARAARGRARRDAAMTLRGPLPGAALEWWGSGQTFPRLNRSRDLNKLLHWYALYSHQIGDDAEAVEAARDMLGNSDVLQRNAPFDSFVGVAAVLDRDAVNAITQVAPDLALEGVDAPPTRPRRKPASSVNVLSLIADLLDETPARGALVRSAWGERAGVLDVTTAPGWEPPEPTLRRLKPAWKLEGLRVMGRYEALARGAAQPTYPAARALLAPPPRDVSRLESIARSTNALHFGFERSLFLHHSRMASRRMAAVALAARLYRAKHAGHWPQTLEQLVPDYLPSVPSDPFDPAGGTLRYRLSGPARSVPDDGMWSPPPPAAQTGPTGPIVYSVGQDGVDQRGSRDAQANLRRGQRMNERWSWQDAVLTLAENPEIKPPGQPANNPPPSGEAQYDEGHERHGRGNDDERENPQ